MAAIQTSPLAVLSLAIPAGVTQLTVNVLADSAGQNQTADYNPGLYIDGVWSTELALSTQSGINAFAINLDGAAHTVEVWNGFQNFKQGAFAYSYSVTGGSGTVTVNPVTVTPRMAVIYTDSIGCAGLANPLTQLGWVPRLRPLYPGRFAIEGWGGRSVWTDSGTLPDMQGLGSMANVAARLVGAVSGATTREILIQIGYNDWGFNGTGLWSATSYGAALTTLRNAIRALDASALIYLASPVLSGSEGIANSFGNTLADYRTQCATVASGQPLVTFVDGTALMTSAGIGGDAIHPTNTGHQAIALGTGADAGTTSWRAVLSV